MLRLFRLEYQCMYYKCDADHKKRAIKSITNKTGNNIPAAVCGLIVSDIRGIDNIAIGPAKPPFEIPNSKTAGTAVKKK